MKASVRDLIDRLDLAAHPEGGWYRETWRSEVVLPREALSSGYSGDRVASTSILFLLAEGDRSRMHRVESEEHWLHHQGDDLELRFARDRHATADPGNVTILGQGRDAVLQRVVPAGAWQEARVCPGPAGYALVGCVVAPGFDFADFQFSDTE